MTAFENVCQRGSPAAGSGVVAAAVISKQSRYERKPHVPAATS